jgi:hypothetical protein
MGMHEPDKRKMMIFWAVLIAAFLVLWTFLDR